MGKGKDVAYCKNRLSLPGIRVKVEAPIDCFFCSVQLAPPWPQDFLVNEKPVRESEFLLFMKEVNRRVATAIRPATHMPIALTGSFCSQVLVGIAVVDCCVAIVLCFISFTI